MCNCYDELKQKYLCKYKDIIGFEIDSIIDAKICIIKRNSKYWKHENIRFKFCPICGEKLWKKSIEE